MAEGRQVFINTQRIRRATLSARLVSYCIHCYFSLLVEPRTRDGLLAPRDPVCVTPITIGCLAPLVQGVTGSHKHKAYVEIRVLGFNKKMLRSVRRHEATLSLKDHPISKNEVRRVVVVLHILNPHGLVCEADPCFFHSKGQPLFKFRTESRHPLSRYQMLPQGLPKRTRLLERRTRSQHHHHQTL